MLKSEALDAIIRISDKKERRFEEFRLDCDKLSKVSIEYPELAHYLIDAAIVIATSELKFLSVAITIAASIK